MIKILKCKKGLTLTELLAGMLIFTIVALSVTAILSPSLRVYIKANELAECNTLLDNLANQIISDLSEAIVPLDLPDIDNELLITTDPSYDIIYTVSSDGVLLKNGNPVLAKDFYKKKSVHFSCVSAESSEIAYTLTVIIMSDKDGEMIRREYAVKPIALNQYNDV